MRALPAALRFEAGMAILGLAACHLKTDPPYATAPRPQPRIAAAPTAPPPQPPPGALIESHAGTLTVRPGQTLYGVAHDENVPARALIDANDLQPPYLLRIGQVLTIPHVKQYIVQPGETLDGIAAKIGVDVAILEELNHLAPPYTVRPGLHLILPAGPSLVAAAPPPRAPSAALPPPGPPPRSIPPPPATTAPRFGAVPLAPPVVLEPPPPKPASGVATPPPDAVATVPPPKPAAPPLKPPPAEPPPAPVPEAPPPEAHHEAPPAPVAAHGPPTAPLFYWPVRGTVIAGYGPASGGTNNDGINIAAPAGTAVSAADAGTVAYADDFKGFGKLVLIKHADGWFTSYAHNSELLVKKGDHVRRGQAIAKIGSTGGVDRPQLHFELRQGAKAVDPLDHLPPEGG